MDRASLLQAKVLHTLHSIQPRWRQGEGEGHTDSRQHAEQLDANAQSQQSCEADAHHTLQDILSHVTDTAYIPSTAYIRERVYTHPIDPNRVHARAFAVLHPQPPAQVLQHIS